MRWFHYNEPGEDGLNQVIKVSDLTPTALPDTIEGQEEE